MSERPVHGAAVRLHHVTRRWGTSVALDRVTIDVAAGSFTVLLGPSGCGKSTCLRLIAGLDEPNDGRVEIDGRDVTPVPPAARGVAMVFQSYALFPHLNVGENILFGLRARNVGKAERTRRLRDAAEMLGIGHLLDRRPAQLSGGQQQRVALGRAVVAQTPVCLMDEPLSNLDAQLRAEMRREVLALQRRLGITMIYVTHDQTEAMSMADQVVLLRDGRVEQDAPPDRIYAHPETTFAASFIGTPPMNLLPLERTAHGLTIAGTTTPLMTGRPDHRGPLLAGIRPETLRLAAAGIEARVTHSEFLGADTIVACAVGAGAARLLARLPGRARLQPGDRVAFALDAPPHIFDATTSRRIVHAAETPTRTATPVST
ncbi:MAG: ABC transporter ATP-binding protein [Rhodospirillales bacterium]|jgi:sn-glycerol 3-phosphate transport system ATP-binding protein|nr:ABC transporter ATP-binding protein [Rhodospirillales bacterium]